GKTFVNTVLFDLWRIAPHNGKKAFGEQAIRLIIRRQNHGFRTNLANLAHAHTTGHPPRLGLITHRGGNPALFPRDDRTALQLWAARLLARRKKRIAINVQDGTGIGAGRQRRAHAYFRITARTTAAMVSSSWG